MTTRKNAHATGVSEQFDMNTALVAGVIQKLWGRSADVYARLRVSHRGLLVEPEDAHACYITLRFPDGSINGSPITLQPEAVVQVGGFLTHNWIEETLRNFLEAAREPNFLDQVPPEDLDAWRKISFRRSSVVLNVLSMTMLDASQASVEVPNQATLEGIVSKTWEYPRDASVDLFARLAVYDQHTRVDETRTGNFGRPRRSPHYVNVLFPDGKVSGHTLQIAEKNRLRVTGELRDLGQQVTLHDALVRTGNPNITELMSRLPGAETLHEITSRWESLHLRANAVILYTNGRPRKKK